MSPIKKLSKRDDQLSSYGTSTSSESWKTSHWPLTRERVLSKYSTMSYSLVTVEANRHRIAESGTVSSTTSTVSAVFVESNFRRHIKLKLSCYITVYLQTAGVKYCY